MKRKDFVFQKLKHLATDRGVSAGELAQTLGLDRANVSRDLNTLWKEGKIEKQRGRPVLYFMKRETGGEQANETVFDVFVQHNPSLKTAVEQGKAAVLYPPRGMHTLILGETGVGKSMFAELMHRYAREVGKMSDTAPMITFNCADYANTPQLLLGQLFGVKKGAYTGAEEQQGLLTEADRGILFLDEIHRLPPEGQEMLFTYIDKGTFRKLGETGSERKADVLLIAATTEDPESILLKTFRRRIPLVIQLPALRERGLEERHHLILQFFKEETVRLGKEIHVSPNTMRAFLHYPCPNNVGQLKTDTQLTCAKAYADFVTNQKEHVQINSSDLPLHVREGLLAARRQRGTVEVCHRNYVFQPDQIGVKLSAEQGSGTQNIYELIEQKFNELTTRGIPYDELDVWMEIDIENYFTQYLKRVKRRMNEGDLAKIIEPQILELVGDIVKYAGERLERALSEKVQHGLALHVQTSIGRIEKGKKIVHPQLNKMRREHKKEFGVALDCVRMIEDRLGIDLPIDEAGFLTMFFVLDYADADDSEDQVHILVMTHGSGGATAMVDVSNQLLGTPYASAIDMPLSMDPKQAFAAAKRHVERTASRAGVLLLVDMGSLMSFGDMLEDEVGVPVKVLPMVSTPHVLEATRKAMRGYSLEQLYEEVKQLSLYDSGEAYIEGNVSEGPKWAILTACLTGQGSALAIKKVLQNYLTYDAALLEIVPVTIADQIAFSRVADELKQNMKILCVVSHFSVSEDIPQFHIEDVLNLKAVDKIQHLIDIEETYHKMAETLIHHLHRVDPQQVISDVRMCLDRLQERLQIIIPPNDLIGVVLHGCCMVDRVVSGKTSVPFKNREPYIETHRGLYHTTREVLKDLESRYEISLSDDEICFMMSFFESEQETEYGGNPFHTNRQKG